MAKMMGTVISIKNKGIALANSENFQRGPEKPLIFPGNDGTFNISENDYVLCGLPAFPERGTEPVPRA